MLKEYLKNQVEEKRSQIATLEKAIIESESKEERAKMGETLTKVRSELEEAEKALGEAEDQEKGEGEKGERRKNCGCIEMPQMRTRRNCEGKNRLGMHLIPEIL